MKRFAANLPNVVHRPRRTATLLTATLVAALAGGPGSGAPDLLARSWAQTSHGGTPTATPPGGGASRADTSRAPTQEELDAAKGHFNKGVEFYQSGNYRAARTEFEVAYALSKYPQLLFNLGKTAEKLNQTADAIRFLDGYLLWSPSAADAAEVHATLAELDKRLAAAPAAMAPAPPSSAVSSIPPVPALALAGIGVGLLIIGIGCGAGALSDANFVKSSGTAMPPVPYATVSGAVNQGHVLDGAGIAFDVLGGLSLAAGGAWTGYWLYQRSKAKKQLSPAVSFVPVHLGAGLAGSF